MLMCMILERYAEMHDLLQQSHDDGTIWSQVWVWLRDSWQTRDFIPMMEVRSELEHENDPAHPFDEVTIESLSGAFPKMALKQVKWVYNLVSKEARLRRLDDLFSVDPAWALRTERTVDYLRDE